jgi:hypothetical protein
MNIFELFTNCFNIKLLDSQDDNKEQINIDLNESLLNNYKIIDSDEIDIFINKL